MIVKQTVSLLAALVSVFDVYVGMTFSLAFQRRGSGAVRGLRRLAMAESASDSFVATRREQTQPHPGR